MAAKPTPDPQGGIDPGWFRVGAAPISTLRLIHLASTHIVVLLALVVILTLPMTTEEPIAPAAWTLLGLGLLGGAIGVFVGRRPPDGPYYGAVVQRHFLAIAITELPALLGFVAAFVADAGFPYWIGGAGSLLASVLSAPTDARLRADDQALQRRGIAASVRAQAYGADPTG